ncbi:APC family permease [Sulfolobus acidocaldarius]|nr:APC family permease [Sulfolobus acidocaldarius]AGE74178.1 transport protein [Sulfolobus acidocaldarius Ron12/I]
MDKSEAKGVPEEPKRHLSFTDIVFLSIGGQSPFLSILTYGVVALLYAGLFGPIAIILGTLLVLVNGMSVYELSKRFTKEGGYYTYAFYSLSKRLGFETGWMYILYSTTYGAGYVFGTAYVLYHVLNINPWIVTLGVMSISALLGILGIKISTKYAIFATLLEIIMMTALAVLLIQSTGFHLYNPFSLKLNLSQLAIAILFGSSIPTGYGSIAPISGETKNARNVISKAIITVILVGGLLAAFDVYAIGTYVSYFHLSMNNVDILTLIRDRLGLLTLVFVLFASINDGIVGSLAFLTATSRTVFAMASSNFLPKFFAKFESYKGPVRAVLLSVLIYFAIISVGLYFLRSIFTAFILISSVALFANLFVHLSANFSLIRISIKKVLKRKIQLIVGVASALYTVYELIYSIAGSVPIVVYVFMSWIIIGFLIAEIYSMMETESE